MTISTTTSRISYTGDGSTLAFAIPFYFQANADIVVYVNSVLQVIGTNYTLTGATLSAGGTCTFVAAPASTYLVVIYRDPQMTQTTSYNNNDPFPAKSHELALDKALTIDQRTRDIAARSLHIPDSESSSTVTTLAVPATRANKLLGFDANGALTYAVGPTFVGTTATGVAEVDSKATAQVTTFAVSVNIVKTLGNATPGDGGGLEYKRGTSGSPSPFQSADGAYWTAASLPNVSASRLLGNPTGSTASQSEISLGSGLAFSSTTLFGFVPPPQGYLTLTSGTPVLAADVTAATSVFYTPFTGNVIAIYDGTNFVPTVFSELTLTLNAAHLASNIYDVYVINDSGTIRLVTGVTWSAGTAGSITAGSCARGTGASGSELQRLNGVWTNKVSTTMRFGASTTTVAANKGTYVGSLYMDGTNGQISCHKAFGQSRKWGVWNAHNRQSIRLLVGDATATWSYSTATIRQSRADATNTGAAFCGLAEESIDVSFVQMANMAAPANSGAGATSFNGIGVNSTTVFSGKAGTIGSIDHTGLNQTSDMVAAHEVAPSLGLNNINCLEKGNATIATTYSGTATDMVMTVGWRG